MSFAATACETPKIPTIPDGKTSTNDQMVGAQGEVKAYIAAMNDYLACVDEEATAKGGDAPAEYKVLMDKRHDTAITEMDSVAAAFNEQVRAFKGANPPPTAR
ncbi:MAG TPA: hypothetical protein VE907_15100 [Gammaproteobacteria bacterium]|nr:hypothetical protein [Gammaproteobacteria bacterium]